LGRENSEDDFDDSAAAVEDDDDDDAKRASKDVVLAAIRVEAKGRGTMVAGFKLPRQGGRSVLIVPRTCPPPPPPLLDDKAARGTSGNDNVTGGADNENKIGLF
jgi:hypothetical protein